MILRRDHIAGFAFVAAGALIYVFSGDLPWGSMAMPGAGMMPKLVLGLMIIFGLVLLARGNASPPLSEIDWSDRGHEGHARNVVSSQDHERDFLGWPLAEADIASVFFDAREGLSVPLPPRLFARWGGGRGGGLASF